MTYTKIVAAAGDIIGTPPKNVPGYVDPGSAGARIAAALNLLFVIATIVATFYAMRAGYEYITSGGEPAKIKAAQAGLQYAVIGLVVTASGYLIVSIVANVLGYDANSLNLNL